MCSTGICKARITIVLFWFSRDARLFNIAVDAEKKRQLELEQQVHCALFDYYLSTLLIDFYFTQFYIT